ncbi:hypothetical protein BDZ89DRAFT_1061696 [Hymenopellis radicata]|nr:hypothetical protein BDZ89DRAFT_1061696 [Hymenopellis radicata]
MKRAQSLRHHHTTRPSLALSSDDLGILREGNETNEDVLRKQLLDRDRECDRLQTQVQSLQAQLAQRPPLESVQELRKEYKDLELLLEGTQRENERCMSELERGKTREKMLERELARFAGENWQANLELPHNSSSISLSLKTPQSETTKTAEGNGENAVSPEVIEKIKLLVMGMEHRLEIRKERLSNTMVEAKQEAQKYEDLTRALQSH